LPTNQISIHVTGLKELANAARKAKDSAVPVALRQANKEIADRVATDARGRLSGISRSGALAASVTGKATATSASVKAGSPGKVPYAAVIHWGWAKHHIAANPFLTDPAAKAEADIEMYYARIAAVVVATV
jgi:phage gpG-like protein